MLETSLAKIERELPDDAQVLDVGGWAKPMARADWVVDILPYETRGLYGRYVREGERFSADTWIQRDICDPAPLPFEDDRFDFVVCAHTLEDVRDPLQVCREMARVGKAGYIETPSRLEEQIYGLQGPWTGWSHHRWLVEVRGNRIEFVFKPHLVNGRESDYFPPEFEQTLSAEDRVETLWWEGSFEFAERVMTTSEEVDPYLADFVSTAIEERGFKRRRRRRARS
jgi:SAM-dependent methyltransferase